MLKQVSPERVQNAKSNAIPWSTYTEFYLSVHVDLVNADLIILDAQTKVLRCKFNHSKPRQAAFAKIIFGVIF